IPLDDQDVFEEIRQADTVGDFQIESRAQMQSLLRTQPENLDDLTVQVALVRPGPIQGKAVHPYIEHRQRLREDPGFVPPVDHPLLAEPLRSTLGVVVFQDQVLDVAIAVAGFGVGEAEGLRRGVGVLPPDVNRSGAKAALEDAGIRVGLEYVASVGEDDATGIVTERERGGPYRDVRDLAQRAPVDERALESLVVSGACDS